MAGSTVSIKTEVLEDLATRFLINVPDDEKRDMVKLCSHMELAHWFYLDHLQPNDVSLPKCNIRQFIFTIFHHYPFLARGSSSDLDKIISKWKAHRHKQPLRGGIILNEPLTKCLLVQGYPFTCVSWGLPKGKLEENEKDVDCAVREIYEETGLDARELIKKEEYLEAKLNGRKAKMFVVRGVSEESLLAPRSMKEIKAIQWFPIETLPSSFKETTVLGQETFNGVIPFVRPLRDWIARHQDVVTMVTNNTKNNAMESLTKTTEHSSMPASVQSPLRSVSTPSRVKALPPDTTASATSSHSARKSSVHASPKSDITKLLLHTPPNGACHSEMPQEFQSRRNPQPTLPVLVSHSPRRALSSQLPPKQSSPVLIRTPASSLTSTSISSPGTVLKSISSSRATVQLGTGPSSVPVGIPSLGLLPSPLKQDLPLSPVPETAKKPVPSPSIPSKKPVPSPLIPSKKPVPSALPLEPSRKPVPSPLIPLEPSKKLIQFTFDRTRILTGAV